MHDPRRTLHIPSLLNARDLGGYPTTDGQVTRWRSVLRADDLAQLTAGGAHALREYAVQTVIDLRWPGEVALNEHPVPRELHHIRYHHISLLAANETEWQGLCGGRSKEMWKCAALDHTRVQMKAVLQAIADAAPGAVLFHCVAGKDRTGVVAALMLALADVLPEAIAYDYAASTTHLRDAYLERYADADRAALIEVVRCPEEGVYNMLEYLRPYGGARGYMEAIGLSDDEIARLRARLRDA